MGIDEDRLTILDHGRDETDHAPVGQRLVKPRLEGFQIGVGRPVGIEDRQPGRIRRRHAVRRHHGRRLGDQGRQLGCGPRRHRQTGKGRKQDSREGSQGGSDQSLVSGLVTGHTVKGSPTRQYGTRRASDHLMIGENPAQGPDSRLAAACAIGRDHDLARSDHPVHVARRNDLTIAQVDPAR